MQQNEGKVKGNL